MFKLNESSSLKLFGKTIPLQTLNQEEEALTDLASEECCHINLLSSSNSFDGVNYSDEYQAQDSREDQETIEKELLKDKHEDSTSHHTIEDLKDTTPAERKTSLLKSSKNEEISETTYSQEKITLKKPDKILLCPRCNSKETKFCYYNNYNVNQPRHLCKNCQRYWTAGGTIRNLPVGSGRRKSKSSSALHYHQILISEAIRAAQASAAAIGIQRNPSCENSNSRVLTFGSGSSMHVASVFNNSGKTHINVQNGFQKPEQRIMVEDNHQGESLITASHTLEKEGNASLNQSEGKKYQSFPSKVPHFAGPSWPYPLDSIQSSTPMLPPTTTLSPPGFLVSFHPAPTDRNYSITSPWDVPVTSSPSSSPTSAALGKHSRDETIVNLSPANSEKEKPSGKSNKSELGRPLKSKTLRIDDPGETVKNSMLATLLIKSNKTNSINSSGLFDGFQPKSSDNRNHRLDSFLMLRANPAALSRSLNFQENT